MKYIEINPFRTKLIEQYSNNGDILNLCKAIVSACMYESDYDKAIYVCNKFAFHTHKDIRRSVLTSLSLIALNFGKLDFKLANKIINYALRDQDAEIRHTANDIIEDLEVNLKEYKFTKCYELS